MRDFLIPNKKTSLRVLLLALPTRSNLKRTGEIVSHQHSKKERFAITKKVKTKNLSILCDKMI